MGRILTVADPDDLASTASGFIMQRITSGLAAGARFGLALSGGRTPLETYRRLAAAPLLGPEKWARVEIYFADERAVAPEDSESNYRLVREALIEPARVPAKNVFRIPAEDPDLERVATTYETRLPQRLDLIVLGLGEDGHTASIFPGSAAAREALRRVVAVDDSPKPPARRVTLTPRALREARDVVVLASGDAKAEAVWRALRDESDPLAVPGRLVREREWIVDEAAAAWLEAPAG
jgi:6-phosphogluconolactonase